MSGFDKKYIGIANWFLFIWVLCAVAPLGLFLWFYYRNGETMPENMTDWGVVGDFVGGLSNPIISALTFMALIFTILQNQKVLKLTEEELAETRKEIELTREANEKQTDEFKSQNVLMKSQAELDLIIQGLIRQADMIKELWESDLGHISHDLLKGQGSIKCLIRQVGTSDQALHLQALNDNHPGLTDRIETLLSHVRIFTRLALEYSEKAENKALLTSVLSVVEQPVKELLARGFLNGRMSQENIKQLTVLLTDLVLT